MNESIPPAIDAWRELYGGELRVLPEPAAGLEAVAVRRADYRPDPGNWPKIFHHRHSTDRVLVLVHGFKDSPGYLQAIALRFAARGINVVLPLLPAHGRRDPVTEMRHADYRAWRSAVDRTVEIAAMLGTEVSIGGLSTGGALAIDKCLRDPPAIAGKVFLFAAALGLSLSQRLIVSTPLLPRLGDAWTTSKGDNGLGGNPIKYTRRFLSAARQVHLLIKDLRRHLPLAPPSRDAGAPPDDSRPGLGGRVFVAHSEADRTIHVGAVKALVDSGDPGQHHIVPEVLDVGHAELVLAEAMTYARRRPGEPDPPHANPEFEPMIEKALAFMER